MQLQYNRETIKQNYNEVKMKRIERWQTEEMLIYYPRIKALYNSCCIELKSLVVDASKDQAFACQSAINMGYEEGGDEILESLSGQKTPKQGRSLLREIKHLERIIGDVDAVLEPIDPDIRNIIEDKFFQGKKWGAIMKGIKDHSATKDLYRESLNEITGNITISDSDFWYIKNWLDGVSNPV